MARVASIVIRRRCVMGLLVPEPGLEPGLPCGKGILRVRRKGDGSTFCCSVAFSHYERYGQRPYFTSVMDTQVDTRTRLPSRAPRDGDGAAPLGARGAARSGTAAGHPQRFRVLARRHQTPIPTSHPSAIAPAIVSSPVRLRQMSPGSSVAKSAFWTL